MPEDFDAQAREELQKLVEWRLKLRRQLNEISDKINGLRLFLGEQHTVGSQATIPRHTGSDKPFTPRGRKMKTILSTLREMYPHGMDVDAIVKRAAMVGVELIPASTRSQLSRLKSQGVVTSRNGAYTYVSTRQPETSGPDLLDQAGPNETEASAETETPDNSEGAT